MLSEKYFWCSPLLKYRRDSFFMVFQSNNFAAFKHYYSSKFQNKMTAGGFRAFCSKYSLTLTMIPSIIGKLKKISNFSKFQKRNFFFSTLYTFNLVMHIAWIKLQEVESLVKEEEKNSLPMYNVSEDRQRTFKEIEVLFRF